jgi:hypothetical protein
MKDLYKILKNTTGVTYQLPIYLEEKFDNMGDMVEFDGEIEQVEQYCNFTYSGYNQTVVIYNTTNTNKFKALSESEYIIDWGDGNVSGLTMPTVYDNNLPSVTHTYTVTGDTIIGVTINSPWRINNVKKTINLPFVNSYGWPTDLGTLTFDIPYTEITGQTQEYLQDYTTLTGTTAPTDIHFIGVGKSRLNEFKTYGSGNEYSIVTITGTTDLGVYTGYTIDFLSYFDYSDGYTYVSGVTSSNNINTLDNYDIITIDGFDIFHINDSYNEDYNGKLTREESLIGFIDGPQIYSDLFIERGKQSVIERNLRLGEIDNMGELEIYGGGYFKVKKQ